MIYREAKEINIGDIVTLTNRGEREYKVIDKVYDYKKRFITFTVEFCKEYTFGFKISHKEIECVVKKQ